MRSFCLALACLSFLVTNIGRAFACSLVRVASTKLEQQEGAWILDAMINGQPARLALDTGAVMTTLTHVAATRLGLPDSWYAGTISGVGGVRDLGVLTLQTLRIGSATGRHLHIGTATMNLGSVNPAIDGLLGFDILGAYDLDIDLVGRKLVMYSAEGGCSKPSSVLADPLYLLELSSDASGTLQADIDVDGRSMRAEFDSGTARSAMFGHAANRLGLDGDGIKPGQHGHASGIGPRPVAMSTKAVGSVQIGGLQFHQMPMAILSQQYASSIEHTGSRLSENSDLSVLLGADFMAKVHVWVSNSSRTLIFQYPPAASPE